MKSSSFFSIGLIFITLFFINSYLIAQNCTVEKESLKGTYSGECKKGKATGIGKAVGIDTYEGNFKSGLPDGTGTYTWSNGNRFKGGFVNGLKNGNGVMTYIRAGMKDSVVEGFWRKDVYIGKHENPYEVYFKSKGVANIQVKYQKDKLDQVTFWLSNTSATGGTMTSDVGKSPNSQGNGKISIDNILLNHGSYSRINRTDTYATKTETIIYDVTFPILMKITFGSETVEIELFEEGSYLVELKVNQ